MIKAFACLLPVIIFGGLIAVTSGTVNASPGETGLSALTLLREGFIGNPYLVPTGPTAHAAPGTVALLAAVYACFGGNTVGARNVLSVIALGQYTTASLFVILHLNATFNGRSRFIAACLLLGILPLYVARAVVEYRQWDQPTSALLLTLIAYIWLQALARADRWRSRALVLGLLGGVGSLFAPILPVTAMIAAAHVSWRRANFQILGMVTVCVVVLMVPWLVRNEIVLGAPIATRSNFGLESALGNNDLADGYYDLARSPALHPHDNIVAARHLAAVGEVAYMREMSSVANRWITEHPLRFSELCARRAMFLLFPRIAMPDPIYRHFWSLLAQVVSLAGLVSAAVLLAGRQIILPWLVCAYLPLLPGVVTHAELRYAFPSFFVELGLIISAASYGSLRLAHVSRPFSRLRQILMPLEPAEKIAEEKKRVRIE